MAIEQRTDVLVRDIRAKTGHRNYDSQSGTPQREFVEYLNDGQERLYNLVLQERPTLFRKTGSISLTAGTSSYSLPDDVYLSHNIVKVDYSSTGNAQDYLQLEQRTSGEEVSVPGYPDSYFLRDGSIILSPIPSSTGTLRLEYQYVIPSLDIRRATISSSSSGGGYVTSYTLSATGLLDETAEDMEDGYVDNFSVVNKHTGAVLSPDTGIQLSSYDSTTRVITLVASTLTTTDAADITTAIAAGTAVVVFGKYASTHSSLPQVAKRYLVEYACMRCQIRDTNALEAALTSPLMRSMEQEVLDAFGALEEDTFSIPITDYSYLGDED
jgi:hypothetical protein